MDGLADLHAHELMNELCTQAHGSSHHREQSPCNEPDYILMSTWK